MSNPLACPKCGHIRQPSENEPLSQCSGCGLIFARYRPRVVQAVELPDLKNASPRRQTAAKSSSAMPAWLVLVVVFVVSYAAVRLLDKMPTRAEVQESSAREMLQNISNKVASETEIQYDMVVRSGTAIDICVQAGLVAASHLQAQNESKYQQWKGIEAEDCKRAGVPR